MSDGKHVKGTLDVYCKTNRQAFNLHSYSIFLREIIRDTFNKILSEHQTQMSTCKKGGRKQNYDRIQCGNCRDRDKRWSINISEKWNSPLTATHTIHLTSKGKYWFMNKEKNKYNWFLAVNATCIFDIACTNVSKNIFA